jgi:hypothetical protein
MAGMGVGSCRGLCSGVLMNHVLVVRVGGVLRVQRVSGATCQSAGSLQECC